MSSLKHRLPGVDKQQGAALIVSLLFLVIMTMIGVTSLHSTTFEERMTGNIRDKSLAFEASEIALMEAEAFLTNNVSTLSDFDSNGMDGLYDESFEKIWEVVDWTGSGANKAISAAAITGIYTPPKYVIEHYATIAQDVDRYNLGNYGQNSGAGDVEMFRITVRGTGGSDNAVSILQTTFGKVF